MNTQAINCVQGNGIMIILISGLVSALVSLIVYFIKENTITKRDNEEQNKQLFENYIDPLITALDSLYWRLKEIIDYDCLYFENNIKDNVYLDYKRKSTMYRLCVVFGQIYLLKHEKCFTILSRLYENLDDQIKKFRSVLADGSWLDMLNTQRVLELIKGTDFDNEPNRYLSIKIENLIFKTFNRTKLKDLPSLSPTDRSIFFDELYSLLDVAVPCDASVQNQIIDILSCRGVFILRDMQDDIGLKMLRLDERDKGSMIGYSEFSEILNNPMFLRIRKLFDEISFDKFWNNIDDTQNYVRYYTIIQLEKKVKAMLVYLKKSKHYQESENTQAQDDKLDFQGIVKELEERRKEINN